MRTIEVNWKELNDLSTRTSKNVEDFTNEINTLIEITESISECWQGLDAENFIQTTKTYFENLKEERDYLGSWANAFKRSATKYNGGVEDGLTKVKQTNESFIKPNPLNEVMINEQSNSYK